MARAILVGCQISDLSLNNKAAYAELEWWLSGPQVSYIVKQLLPLCTQWKEKCGEELDKNPFTINHSKDLWSLSLLQG